MSKWRKALKNKKKFDARYFLNERVENQEVVENSVQQEEVKRNFHDFSFDSWLTEDQELEEAHCTSKRDDDEELEEMHCGSSKRDDEELEEMHCTSKRDDEEELEEGKGKYDDGDGKDEKCDYVDCEGTEEELEELQLGGDPKPDGREVKGMTPEEIRMAKAKAKMDLLRKASRDKPPVKKDIKRGLEESELEEG